MSQLLSIWKPLTLLLITTFILSACSKLPDEVAINQRINNIVEGLNAKDSAKVLDQLTLDFTGSHAFDRNNARGTMALYFLRHKAIDVVLSHKKTMINGSTASTQATAVIAGRSQLLPESGRLISLTGRWEKYDDQWLLRELTWK